jgi:hypothetical protein
VPSFGDQARADVRSWSVVLPILLVQLFNLQYEKGDKSTDFYIVISVYR